MNKIVPFSINFSTLRRINNAGSLILYSSALIIVFLVSHELFSLVITQSQIKVLNSFLSFLSVAYFLQDLLQNYLFQLSEVHRRNDFLDNSLDTSLSDKSSEGYFSNDALISGVNKLGVNCFENSFFTKSITSLMIPFMLIKLIIIILLFIFLALFTDQLTISTMMQVALPLTIIQQFVRLVTLHFRVNSIYNQFKVIFTSIDGQKRDSYLITNVINYESTLAWAGILLDSKIYTKQNETLSQDWENIKIKNKIK